MKILLVNPPNCGRSIPEERYGITSLRQLFKGEPFSLEVLAGPLSDHDVVIFDGKCEEEDALGEVIAGFEPEVVGFTAMTCEANTVIRLAAEINSIAVRSLSQAAITQAAIPAISIGPSLTTSSSARAKKVLPGLSRAWLREFLPIRFRASHAPGRVVPFHTRRVCLIGRI